MIGERAGSGAIPVRISSKQFVSVRLPEMPPNYGMRKRDLLMVLIPHLDFTLQINS